MARRVTGRPWLNCRLCDARDMLREFLNRPLVRMALGTLFLLIAISSFASGGTGIIIGLVVAVVGGYELWSGFTKWREERS